MTKTLPSRDGSHKWQVQVRQDSRGEFRAFFRDDSEGKWGTWRQAGFTWTDGGEAMAQIIQFVNG
jgi:hypothetical protein